MLDMKQGAANYAKDLCATMYKEAMSDCLERLLRRRGWQEQASPMMQEASAISAQKVAGLDAKILQDLMSPSDLQEQTLHLDAAKNLAETLRLTLLPVAQAVQLATGAGMHDSVLTLMSLLAAPPKLIQEMLEFDDVKDCPEKRTKTSA